MHNDVYQWNEKFMLSLLKMIPRKLNICRIEHIGLNVYLLIKFHILIQKFYNFLININSIINLM